MLLILKVGFFQCPLVLWIWILKFCNWHTPPPPPPPPPPINMRTSFHSVYGGQLNPDQSQEKMLQRMPKQIYLSRFLLTHSHNNTFWRPWETSLLKTLWGKELRAISPFPTVFSTRLDNFIPFLSNLKLSSANSFSMEESKICRLVMG